MPAPRVRCRCACEDTLLVVSFGIENLRQLSPVEEQMVPDALLDTHRRVVIDLFGVTNISKTLIGKMLALWKCMKNRGGSLLVTNVSPSLFEDLCCMRLEKFLDIRVRHVS